LTIYFWFLSV